MFALPDPGGADQGALRKRRSYPLEAMQSCYRFGNVEVRCAERRILVSGQPTTIGARAFDVLVALIEHRSRVLSRDELLSLVWPGLVVEEANIQVQVSALRKIIGPHAVATIPGRGYRFSAVLEPDEASNTAPVELTGPGFVAPVATSALRVNLPAVLPPLIGRRDEMTTLSGLLDEHRLVTVIGAGGIGKSSLARAVLHARRSTYAHGACWVELAAVDGPGALLGAIAGAIGVRVPAGESLTGVGNAISSLELLVALDNAEHLLADVAAIADLLLQRAPGLRLLVTSQAPLRVGAERVMRIEGLAVPACPMGAADALTFGAIDLFAERARAMDARFRLTDNDAPAAIELCRALDGHALAIELAAVRAPLLGVQRLAHLMGDRLRLLTENQSRAAPSRQQTLRSALEWSYALLEPREQAAFQRLAVAVGSASLELVQGVCVGSFSHEGIVHELDEWGVLDALSALVERSLVSVLAGSDSDPPRYRLLDSPRIFALEQLAKSGEDGATRLRHAVAVRDLLQSSEEAMEAGRLSVAAWQHRAELDIDNGRAAFLWAQSAGRSDLALAIGCPVLRSLPPGMHSDRSSLANACEAMTHCELPPTLLRRAWRAISFSLNLGPTERSRAAADKALALARDLDPVEQDRYELYRAICRSVLMAATMDDSAAAQPLVTELRAIEDPHWPPVRRRLGAAAAAWAAIAAHRTADALQLQRLTLALERAAGTDGYSAMIGIADTELVAGNVEAAIREGTELVDMLRGTRDGHRLAYASINLAAACLAAADTARARELLSSAWPLGLRFELHPWCAQYMALLAALERRPDASARLAGSADARYAAAGAHRHVNEALAQKQVRLLVVSTIGEAEFERLKDSGRSLSDEDTAALAFSYEDT